MNDVVVDRKWWARALLVGGVVALVLLPIGALGARLGIWPFMGGFLLLAVGVVLGITVVFLGIVGAVYAQAKARFADRNDCLIGATLGVVIIGVMLGPFMAASAVPPIHNISTDTQDPPQFAEIAKIRDALTDVNPHAYDAEALAEQQRAAYPSVKPLISATPRAQMVERVSAVLESLGMEVVNVDASAGIVEATDTTFWFGFKDDVVVRVRQEGAGSVVDVRSVSRVGQSDLGKNAERILSILGALQPTA